MNSWNSYPSIYNLGHRAIKDLFSVDCYVEEKIDGSQFSFGLVPDTDNPEPRLRVRSKGAEMYIEAPEKMFTKAVESVKAVQHLLVPGWTYRAEYLQKPKHNLLAYDRVPKGHLIIFDVNTGDQEFLLPAEKAREAARLGFECVPVLSQMGGKFGQPTEEQLRKLFEFDSVLGGQKIEGFVIKQWTPTLYGVDKKTLMGKFVSERFREIHKQEWRKENPTKSDVVDMIAKTVCTEARWEKAIAHLKERGELEGSPRDIGKLIKEVPQDVDKECTEMIQSLLMKHFMPEIRRRITHGLPEWYKDRLLREQLNQEG